MSRLALGLLSIAMSVTSLATAPEVEVGDVGSRVVSGPDEDGELLISLKVTVTNHTDAARLVALSIQGCDSDGFELFETSLRGTVDAGEARTLTDTEDIESDVYESISEWRIDQ